MTVAAAGTVVAETALVVAAAEECSIASFGDSLPLAAASWVVVVAANGYGSAVVAAVSAAGS